MTASDAGDELTFEISRGVVRLGHLSLDIERLEDGTLRVGGPAGPRVRRLLFAERSDVVAAALRGAEPARTLPGLLVERCTLEPGTERIEPLLLAAVCLHLCGADLSAPDDARTQRLVAHLTGWTTAHIGRQPAVEIDGMAVQFTALLGSEGEHPGRSSQSPGGSGFGRLVENLLGRAPRDGGSGALAEDELALLERLGALEASARRVIANTRGAAASLEQGAHDQAPRHPSPHAGHEARGAGDVRESGGSRGAGDSHGAADARGAGELRGEQGARRGADFGTQAAFRPASVRWIQRLAGS